MAKHGSMPLGWHEGLVSRWSNAILNRRFLSDNFRPKTEWPPATE